MISEAYTIPILIGHCKEFKYSKFNEKLLTSFHMESDNINYVARIPFFTVEDVLELEVEVGS